MPKRWSGWEYGAARCKNHRPGSNGPAGKAIYLSRHPGHEATDYTH